MKFTQYQLASFVLNIFTIIITLFFVSFIAACLGLFYGVAYKTFNYFIG